MSYHIPWHCMFLLLLIYAAFRKQFFIFLSSNYKHLETPGGQPTEYLALLEKKKSDHNENHDLFNRF